MQKLSINSFSSSKHFQPVGFCLSCCYIKTIIITLQIDIKYKSSYKISRQQAMNTYIKCIKIQQRDRGQDKMSEIEEIKLLRKFTCKHKLNYQQHVWLIFRIQLVYELLIILCTCLVNMSFHFHLSHVYTTQFWTSEDVASSNFGLALASLLMIPYTIKIQQAKSSIVKDLHFTMLLFHMLLCIIYNHLSFTISYTIFASILCIICITMGSFIANIVEQKKLHSQISQIEMQDRKTYKNVGTKETHDPLEHHQLTEVQFQQIN